MDFSAFNPQASNALNMAARNNEVTVLKRLLRKNNPNCVDNRGWTCLHEAAANDRYECLRLILDHPDCRPLAETFEGHTALYLACRNKCSLKSIKLILDTVEDIAQYASTEMVSPLHLACQHGDVELVELLLSYNSIINLPDFDEDTPLHDAAFAAKYEIISVLLHAGAEPEMRNQTEYTPLHAACMQGCLESVSRLHPFVSDINMCTSNSDTPLILASQKGSLDVVEYLLKHGADPDLTNDEGRGALMTALVFGHAEVFCALLKVTHREHIDRNIFLVSCKPLYFKIDIVVALLESDLGPEFFSTCETFTARCRKFPSCISGYRVGPALGCFLNVGDYIYNRSPELFRKLLYLILMRGVAVDAQYPDECPPLAYLQHCDHANCFDEVLTILISHGCNIDYKSDNLLPDVILASLMIGGHTLPSLLQYSLAVEPDDMITWAVQHLTASTTTAKIFNMIGPISFGQTDAARSHRSYLPTLQHLCRLKIRQIFRINGIDGTKDFLQALNRLPLPKTLINFLRYVV